MQLPWDEHFYEIVIPAWQAYLAAEQRLTDALAAKNGMSRARYDALREGGAASSYVHHFGEVVLRARPAWLPKSIQAPHEIIGWLAPHCTMLRTTRLVPDVELLRDVADALKHAILTRRAAQRQVGANDAVLAMGSGFGMLRFGEGKYGGIEEVLVKATTGTRALSGILQNVVDAWRRVAGLPLPPTRQP
jgi:hypothetical protein